MNKYEKAVSIIRTMEQICLAIGGIGLVFRFAGRALCEIEYSRSSCRWSETETADTEINLEPDVANYEHEVF